MDEIELTNGGERIKERRKEKEEISGDIEEKKRATVEVCTRDSERKKETGPNYNQGLSEW